MMLSDKTDVWLMVGNDRFKSLQVDKNDRLVVAVDDLGKLSQATKVKLDMSVDEMDSLIMLLLSQRDEKKFFEDNPEAKVYYPLHRVNHFFHKEDRGFFSRLKSWLVSLFS